MFNKSTTSIFCLLLIPTLIKLDLSISLTHESQLNILEHSDQSSILLARVVHDSNDSSQPKEEKT